MFRKAIVALCVVSSLYAAPRPGKKPEKAMQVTPGNYKMLWNGGEWNVTLTANGAYDASGQWIGGYSWDTRTREFAVSESCDGGFSYLVWRAKLDDKLKGDGVLGANSPITLELIPK